MWDRFPHAADYPASLTSVAPLLIAAHASDQSTTSFDGTLDELQIYKQVLTADQVTALGSQASLDYCE